MLSQYDFDIIRKKYPHFNKAIREEVEQRNRETKMKKEEEKRNEENKNNESVQSPK